jgi:WD40 repeat protein
VTRISLTVDRSGSVALPVAGITALSPVGDTIAVVESDGSVSFWSARRGNQIGTADVSVSGTSDLARTQGAVSDIGGVPVFSADGTRLYVRDSESLFSVVDVDSGDVVAEVDLPVGRTQSALAASGAFIATGHTDGTVMLWDAASFGSTDEPIAAWQLIDEVGACATGSDPASTGIRLIGMKESTSSLLLRVIDECGTAAGWEIIDPKPVNVASFANAFVVDFGSDDSYLVSQQGTRLRLLTEDGTVVRDFDAHSEEIRQTSTSRDLGTMASVSRDLIGLWYTRSGESLASGITGSQAHVAGDGSFVVTSGGSGFDWFGGPVVVWDLDPDTWEEQACEAAGRNLSFFEWEQFFPTEVYRLTCPQWPSGL